jgi:integrase
MSDDQTLIPASTAPLALLPADAPTSLDQNPAAVYLASLGPGSRRTMRTALTIIAQLLGVPERRDAEGHDLRWMDAPWSRLRYQHTAAIRAQLKERYAPATANKLLAALRRVMREARRLGQIGADDYDSAVDLPTIRAQRLPRGRLVTEGEITALLRVCAEDPTPAGARDSAILALLRGAGLRRSEAAALDLADVDIPSGAVTVRSGKGDKDRVVYAPAGARAALRDWIDVRGENSGPLFYGVVKGGRLVPRRLAGQAMAVICAARAAEAGIQPFTPHDLRRTFISGLLDAGADMAVVQRLAGHEDPATTSRYDRRGEVAKQRAIELVHVPHFQRRRESSGQAT